MTTLYFPNLGWQFKMNPVAFQIGSLQVRWYGIIIALAFLLALIYVFKRVKEFGLDADRVIDVILIGTVGAIIGARLYYVAFQWDEFKYNPVSILYIWEGGIAIYGGLIGAFLAGALACKLRKVKTLPLFDLAASALLLGQGIGRWGNFVNVEAFGSNTKLPWGMTSVSIQNYLAEKAESLAAIGVTVNPNIPVHPTFLYEFLWCIIGFVLIAIFVKHRRFDGEIFLMYTGWYGLGRTFIEGLRTDSLMLGNLRVSQILAALLFLASLVTWVVIRLKIRTNNDPEYLKLYVNTDEGQRVLAGTYYKKSADPAAEIAPDMPETPDETPDETSGGEESPDVDSSESEEASEDVDSSESAETSEDVDSSESEEASEDVDSSESMGIIDAEEAAEGEGSSGSIETSEAETENETEGDGSDGDDN